MSINRYPPGFPTSSTRSDYLLSLRAEDGPLILNQDEKGRWNLPLSIEQDPEGTPCDMVAEEEEHGADDEEDGRILVSLSNPAYVLFPSDVQDLIEELAKATMGPQVVQNYFDKFLVATDSDIDEVEVEEC